MIKKCSCTFYFLLVVLILFLFGLQFLQRGLMFHYIHTFIMFKHAAFGKHTWIHTSKIKKNKLILKFHPRMKCLHVFFSSQDEISSRQKRVNSKRHFTIDRDDFILGQVSSLDKISRVNTLLEKSCKILSSVISDSNMFISQNKAKIFLDTLYFHVN